jgi:aldose 1-epimerase
MSHTVCLEGFGRTADGTPVTRARLSNGMGLSVSVLSYGGILQQLSVPDRGGRADNIVLGFDDLTSYEKDSPYFGAIIGRYANRIRAGAFTIDDVVFSVGKNDPFGSVHGGQVGFDKRVWQLDLLPEPEVGVRLRYRSPDGEEGFPGTLDVRVDYVLSRDENVLTVTYSATTDRPTVVNMTNHSYFNLAGEGSGSILDHELEVAAEAYLPVDVTLLPTGELAPVEGTPFDFRCPRVIGERIRQGHEQLRLGNGYDHNFVLRKSVPGSLSPEFAARLRDPGSGRELDVWTTEPGLDVYTGNFLDGSLVGAGGRAYRQGDAIALEPEHFTDSPNIPAFPSTILRPGQEYRSMTEYRFGVSPLARS